MYASTALLVVWVRACVRACVRVCVCVLNGEGSRMYARTALLVVWTAVYLTGYSDYLTGFRESLSLPYWAIQQSWFDE